MSALESEALALVLQSDGLYIQAAREWRFAKELTGNPNLARQYELNAQWCENRSKILSTQKRV